MSDFLPKKSSLVVTFLLTFLACTCAVLVGQFLVRYTLVDLTGKVVGDVKPSFNAQRNTPSGAV